MPSAFTHIFVSIASGKAVMTKRPPMGLGLMTMALAVLPDLDTLGLRLGVAYESFWGHRGFMHSLPFAMAASLLAALLAFRRLSPFAGRWRFWGLWLLWLVIAATHPLLDAMTDGGLGIALFWPVDDGRYFLPWTPIRVSPIGIRGFLSRNGAEVLLSELLWVWLPATALAAGIRAAIAIHRRGREGRRGLEGRSNVERSGSE